MEYTLYSLQLYTLGRGTHAGTSVVSEEGRCAVLWRQGWRGMWRGILLYCTLQSL